MSNPKRALHRRAMKAVRRSIVKFSKGLLLTSAFGILEPSEVKDMQAGLKALQELRAKLGRRLKQM